MQKSALIAAGLCDEKSAAALVSEVADEMEAAVKWASNASMPEPQDLWTGVYAD